MIRSKLQSKAALVFLHQGLLVNRYYYIPSKRYCTDLTYLFTFNLLDKP